MKLLLLGGPNIGPYHYARFSELAKLEPEFAYVKIPAGDVYRPWQKDRPAQLFNILNISRLVDVWGFLSEQKPDILITVGYANYALLLAALWAKCNKTASVLINESTREDKPRNKMKEATKRFFISHLYDACFATGSRAADYAVSLGMNKNLIWHGAGVVDNDHFARLAIRNGLELNLPMRYFFCAARLSGEKNIGGLLRAFEIYRVAGGHWALVIAGTGPLEKQLRESVHEKHHDALIWTGWSSYSDLSLLYQNASCFILPSLSEPWGLVTNEAMAAGLPILVSNKCGCAPDLCQEGINGFIFDPMDYEDLAVKMLSFSSGCLDTVKMGEISRQIIANYTPQKWAATLMDLCTALTR